MHVYVCACVRVCARVCARVHVCTCVLAGSSSPTHMHPSSLSLAVPAHMAQLHDHMLARQSVLQVYSKAWVKQAHLAPSLAFVTRPPKISAPDDAQPLHTTLYCPTSVPPNLLCCPS